MIEVCSLDFLKKKKFDTDILTVDGRVLCSKDDQITSELLLRLYFKDIYIKEPIVSEKIDVQAEPEEVLEQLSSMQADLLPELVSEVVPEPEIEKIVEEEVDLTEKLEFDEGEAKRVSEYSLMIGKALNYTEKQLKDLEQAAYYHNVGRTNFTKADLGSKDFLKNQANAGYEIILKDKKLPQEIAEVASLYNSNYDSSAFKLDECIPFYQVVGVASFYDRMIMQNYTKEETLAKMLQLGGNKFNIFVLHKFISMMRK